ncbi:MAG: hypothetical protein AB2551_12345 [Candidatus Thiodiazotropha sp.]
MDRQRKFNASAMLLMLLLLLTACGGGGGSNGDDDDNTPEQSFRIGGNVNGLNGTGLVLQNNGGDDLNITADGEFSFATSVQDGGSYLVTIATQPGVQQCTVVNGNGAIDGAAVTDVLISCLPDAVSTPEVSVAGPKLLRFSWNDVAADHYRLLKNPDGVSGFSQVGENITVTGVDEEIAVHLTDWANLSYMVQSCNSVGDCVDSPQVTVDTLMLDLVGYIKPSYIGTEDQFASIVALSGDGRTLAVGVPRDNSDADGIDGDPVVSATNSATDSGAVYLFVREGDGWSQQAYIKASNSETIDLFATSLSLSDDGARLAVGAVGESSAATGIDGDQTDNSLSYAGAVYIFDRSGSTWSQQSYIKAADAAAGSGFGAQVSLSASGERLAVSGGGVYLFEEGSEGWFQQTTLSPSDGETDDGFGKVLQLSADGGTLAVSAPSEDSAVGGINGDVSNNEAESAGAVYVFAFDGNGWTQQAYIKSSVPDIDDRFGTDLSLSGDGNSLAVTASGEDSSAIGLDGDPNDNSSLDSGAAYLYERESGEWQQSLYLKASNAEQGDRFGFSIALSDDGSTLAVGAVWEASIAVGVNGDQSDNSAAAAPPGAVYLFKRGDTTWSQQAYVKASNTDAGWEQPICFLYCPDLNDEFGASLDISKDGETLVVGAPLENSGDAANQQDDTAPFAGAAYLY